MSLMQKLKQYFAPRDLTQGSVMGGIVQFSIPLLIGNIAQQLYNTVDAIVVGQYVGDDALGAVGMCGSIINLLVVLAIGISTGATIVISQLFGAKNRDGMSKGVGATVMLATYGGIIMSVLGYFLTEPLLRILSTPESMLEYSRAYLRIFMIGFTGTMYYNILSGVLRGLGDSVSPLLYLLLCTVLNIFLDLFFVLKLHMTTDGVAWATIISQAISGVLCLIKLMRMKELLTLDRNAFRLHKDVTTRIVKLGVPSGLTQMIFATSNILVQNLINTLGAALVTANTVIMRVDGFAMMPNFTFGTAATTFTGQNVGANRMDRVKEGTRALLILAVGMAMVLVLAILLFGPSLMRVFTNTEEIVELGSRMLRVLAVGYIVFAVSQVTQGVMRGAGETMLPMWISIISTVGIRLPLAYAWAALTKTPETPNGSPMSIFGSLLVTWILACIINCVVYAGGKWKRALNTVVPVDVPQKKE